jgi:catechol 2,3-dioxygenase-like lactoylglutathione lyase family enzyme
MTVKAGWVTPMLHARSIEDSIRFYRKLGFELIDTDRHDPIGWARIHCEGGALMFLRAEEDTPHEATPGMYFMYTPDLPALRAQLIAQGVDAPKISHPDYTPSGELALRDPDGNLVLIVHWSEAENSAWLERIKQTPPLSD